MESKYRQYRYALDRVPEKSLAWNMYGSGLECIGRRGEPEEFSVPDPGPGQLLVRIDSVGMCFSDVKLIRQGGSHPKLYNRDLQREPTRLGHEVALTVVKVGEALQDRYRPGQRLAVQPDIYQQGQSTAYGYTVPGGLIQYHLIGPEVLDTDEGACLLPLEGDLGYAESSLLEPWGCVVAAYTQRRRLRLRKGGAMWIVGRPSDETDYAFSEGIDAPEIIVLSDAPASIKKLAEATDARIFVRDDLTPADYQDLADEFTEGRGFDDIVVLDPQDAGGIGAIARHVARRGTMNMVGDRPLGGLVDTDVGRLHYDYIAFVGNRGPDISASYGEDRNRCELRPGGIAVFIGAGGPMGQMHVQRAIELPTGPQKVVATEINDERLETLRQSFAPLAEEHGCELHVFNPQRPGASLHDFVMDLTGGQGADDVVVCVPVAPLMADADTLMKPDGMLVLFAGVPNGTLAPLDLSNVYLHNAQYTGTSGLTLADQRQVMERALEGSLSPERVVAAIGGIHAAREGLQALMDGRYPGKIVIFPQLPDLPLMGLDELEEKMPEVAKKLGPGGVWTQEAEAALFEQAWKGNSDGS